MTPISRVSRARLDPSSRVWLEQLTASGAVRDAAIGRLHAILLTEARHEMRWRTARMAHPSGRDLDDLAVQAADDALMAILAKLDQFRGDALFTTWARRFAALEVPGAIRRRRGRGREILLAPERWPPDLESGDDVVRQIEAREMVRAVSAALEQGLTRHQREVLLALTVEQMPAKDLAVRLDSTPGALYKTLHDARRKLRSRLQPSGVPVAQGGREVFTQ